MWYSREDSGILEVDMYIMDGRNDDWKLVRWDNSWNQWNLVGTITGPYGYEYQYFPYFLRKDMFTNGEVESEIIEVSRLLIRSIRVLSDV